MTRVGAGGVEECGSGLVCDSGVRVNRQVLNVFIGMFLKAHYLASRQNYIYLVMNCMYKIYFSNLLNLSSGS